MALDLSILVPVLRRPGNILPLLDSIAAATTCEYEVVFLVSTNDRDELRALQALDPERHPRAWYAQVTPHPVGDYAKKMNHGYRITTAPWLFLGADDLRFHRRWWENSAELREQFGVIGTQDMGNRRVRRGYHSTHTLVSRRYTDERGVRGEPGVDVPGQVLWEGYPHAYVDDELVATAKFRGEWAFSHGSLVEHLHPNWGKSVNDDTYEKSRVSMSPGLAEYQSRRHLWGEK